MKIFLFVNQIINEFNVVVEKRPFEIRGSVRGENMDLSGRHAYTCRMVLNLGVTVVSRLDEEDDLM
jgi:hypothetical protein